MPSIFCRVRLALFFASLAPFAAPAVWSAAPTPAGLPALVNRVAQSHPALAAGEVVLLIRAGGAYEDVQLLSGPGVSAARVAGALKVAARGTILAEQDVETNSSSGVTAARVHSSRASVGNMSLPNIVTAGWMMSGLRHEGLEPKLLIGIPANAETNLHAARYVQHGTAWYDATALPVAGPVLVSVSAGRSDEAAVLPAVFFIPLVALAAGVVLGAGKRIRPTILAAAALTVFHGLVLIDCLQTAAARSIADLWLGVGDPIKLSGGILAMTPGLLLAGYILGREHSAERRVMSDRERALAADLI